jgi:hypothetical protein
LTELERTHTRIQAGYKNLHRNRVTALATRAKSKLGF